MSAAPIVKNAGLGMGRVVSRLARSQELRLHLSHSTPYSSDVISGF